MKKYLLSIFATLFISTITLAAFEPDSKLSGEDVAKDNVKRVIKFYNENGKNKEKLFAEINKTDGQFVSKDKEFYAFVFSITGITLARGDGNLKLIGKERINDQDTNGKYYVKEIIKVATTAPNNGWVAFTRKNPKTGLVENKIAYIEKVDDLVIGCGAYKGK